MKTNNFENKGWLSDVLDCVNKINHQEFCLSDVYEYADDLRAQHVDNHNVEAKIRQQLQVLRDKGYIEFLGNGQYRKLI